MPRPEFVGREKRLLRHSSQANSEGPMTFHKIRTIPRPHRTLAISAGIFVVLLALCITPMAGRALIQQNGTYVPNAVNRVPDANERDKMQQANKDRFEASNVERQQEVSAERER